MPEPCLWVSCKYHLLFEDKKIVRSHMNMTDEEIVAQLPRLEGRSCALKMAEKEQTLQAIGDIFGVSRERIRQIGFWRTHHEGALVNLLKEREFRLLLRGYYECEIKNSRSS